MMFEDIQCSETLMPCGHVDVFFYESLSTYQGGLSSIITIDPDLSVWLRETRGLQ
jgi:hypothetical protein